MIVAAFVFIIYYYIIFLFDRIELLKITVVKVKLFVSFKPT